MANFIGDYLHFTDGNEAHPRYHLWSCLAALSSIISRRIWIDQGYFRVYPNIYVVLVGAPGLKKSTAMSIAKGLIRKLGDIPFSAECQTKESLVKMLSECGRQWQPNPNVKPIIYTPISIFITELSQFLGPTSGHMIDFLTTVYGEDFYDLKTKNQGEAAIVGPYVTILACTTPSWITSYLKTDIITGGFSRRTLFILEFTDGDPVPFPEIRQDQHDAMARVLQYSRDLSNVGGQFTWKPDAKKFYEDWYRVFKRKLRSEPVDPNILGYLGTKHIQLLKVAMLLAISKETNLVMTIDYLELGLSMLTELETNLPKVFQGMGRNELNMIAGKVLEMLEAAGPVKEKQLRATLFSEASGGEMDQILEHLERSGQIARMRTKTDPPILLVGLPKHFKK